MKVHFFANNNVWGNHFEHLLELMQRHLDKNDDIELVICNGQLLPCEISILPSEHICFDCINTRVKGLKLLSKRIKQIEINLNKSISINLDFDSISDLKNIVYKNFDAGYAALSTLVTLTRNSEPEIEVYRERFSNYINQGIRFYDFISDHLSKNVPDLVYIFNGRFLYVRAALRACQSLNISSNVLERGHDIYHFEIFENTFPHNLNYIKSNIEKRWDNSVHKYNSKIEIAEVFYNHRRSAIPLDWYAFTENQINVLPEDWDDSKRNIAIFNSSEDEFVAISDEWHLTFFYNQIEGIKFIVQSFINERNLHFYLRIHPNLIGINTKFTSELANLKYSNLTVISADDKVSTYKLLDNCEKVITFGSTMGIEACYWRKPSILLGKSYYYDMEATYNPDSREELLKLISEKLDPMPILGALKYGYYFNTYGEKFKYFHPEGILGGKFNGRNIHDGTIDNLFLKLINKIIRLPKYCLPAIDKFFFIQLVSSLKRLI